MSLMDRFEEEAMNLMENEDTVEDNSTEDNVEYQLLSEEDEANEKKQSRENARVRDLIDQKKEMEEMLKASREELEKLRNDKTKEQSINSIPDEVDKHELFKKLKSDKADDFIEGLESISKTAMKKILMEELAEIKNPLDNLARNNRALQDGVSVNELEKVFAKYPNLRDQPNGYDIAKELIKKSTPSRAKDFSTKKSSSVPATGNKQKMTRGDFKRQLSEHLRNGGGF